MVKPPTAVLLNLEVKQEAGRTNMRFTGTNPLVS
jgi:hypothetical protein